MSFKKVFLLLIQVFACTCLFAQEILLERSLDMQLLFKEKRESYPVVNEDDGTLALFLMDYKTIQAQLLDRNLNIITSLADFKPGSEFSDLLGCSFNQGVYNLFFINKKKDKFYCKTLDMVNVKHEDHEIPLKLKGEKYLECVNYKNRFYILTVVKSGAILKIYEFENNQNYQVREIDLSSLKFSKSKFATLYDILIKGANPSKLGPDFQKVNIQNPNSMEIASHAIKLYYYDNKIFLTFDNEPQETKLLTISLSDYSFTYSAYKQGVIDCGEAVVIGSNSFLYNNILFQVKECSQELYFSVYDILTGAILKDFRVNRNEEIAFKNTPFVQEGGTTLIQQNSKKELENTKVLLHKMAAGYAGVSAYSSSGSFVVTLGGYYEVQHMGPGVGIMMASSGGVAMSPAGNIVSIPPTYNYNSSMLSYRSYKNSRSVYFKSVLDSNTFDHRPGKYLPNAFDKISDFSEPIEKQIVSETIFKINDYYVFGYYDANEKKYYLRKFTD
ncbi:MAG: hypothetical protein WCR72_13030 [Bacteroidota bacterium]